MNAIFKLIAVVAIGMTMPSGLGAERTPFIQDSERANKDVLDLIASQPELSLFAEALKAAGLEPTLRLRGPWTILAPSNDAFRALPEGQLTEWSKPENRGILGEVIRYHVIRGPVEVPPGKALEVTTLQGSRVVLTDADNVLFAGRAEVVRRGLEGANGVVHVVNMVLEPDAE